MLLVNQDLVRLQAREPQPILMRIVIASMRKQPTRPWPTDLAQPPSRNWPRLLCSLVVGLAVLLSVPPSSLAKARTAGSRSVIACFHRKSNRFTAEAHPRQCNIAGQRGEDFVQVPIKGMKWGHWGANPTRGAYGTDTRNGRAVRIIAHLPVTCPDGRTWYSRVVVVFPGIGRFFGLHLQTCELVRGRFW
jgi:hypothetical protein